MLFEPFGRTTGRGAGRRSSFSLYEDDGVSPGYKQGKFARVPMTWNEVSDTIGPREGRYDAMPATRAMSVRFHTPGRAAAPDFSENPAGRFVYEGKPLMVRRP